MAMIAAFDVHYPSDGGASGAAVLFRDYRDAAPAAELNRFLPHAAAYVPGEFFRRELPCILALLALIHPPPSAMIVDGYVMPGGRPGLGLRLFEAAGRAIPVMGVAKSPFDGGRGSCTEREGAGGSGRGVVAVFRGGSRRPLYVTAAGMDVRRAALNLQVMHGPHRIPTLLRRVDALARTACGGASGAGRQSSRTPRAAVSSDARMP